MTFYRVEHWVIKQNWGDVGPHFEGWGTLEWDPLRIPALAPESSVNRSLPVVNLLSPKLQCQKTPAEQPRKRWLFLGSHPILQARDHIPTFNSAAWNAAIEHWKSDPVFNRNIQNARSHGVCSVAFGHCSRGFGEWNTARRPALSKTKSTAREGWFD